MNLRPRERSVLAALVAGGDRGASIDRISELVWGDDRPKTARKSIQNHVARIRSAASGVIETVDDGYGLSSEVSVDVESGSDDLVPYADLADSGDVEAVRQAAFRNRGESQLVELSQRLETGSGIDALGDVERWVAAHPDDERGVRLLVRVLGASGRRRDALTRIRSANREAAATGRAPDRLLRDFERRLLDDDPTLGGDMAPPSEGDVVGAPQHLVGLGRYIEHLESDEALGDLTAITGPAGIGKTTLVEHVRDRADATGRVTLLASCSPEPSIPLEPFTEVLHQLAERFPDAVAELDDLDALRSLAPTLLPEVSADPAPSGADRSTLMSAIAAAMRCAPAPITVVFEDLHWATPLTVEMLRSCATTTTDGHQLQILVTSREASSQLLEIADHHMVVEPWSRDDVRAYVDRFGRSDTWCAPAAEWIHRQSGGTALFIRELTVAAHAGPVTQSFDPPLDTPENLEASLRQTLSRLSASAQRDVSAAAVLGRRFRSSECSAMTPSASQSMIEAIDEGIVQRLGDDELLFRHDLLHRLVLDQLSDGQRIELHDLALRAISDSIADDGEVGRALRLDELSHHALRSASLDRHRAIDTIREAVDADLDRFAYEAGVEHCRSALAVIADGLEPFDTARVEFETRLGDLLLRLGDPGALDQLLRAARLALDSGDDDLVAEALREACRLGPTSVVGTVHPEAAELLDLAAERVNGERAAAAVNTAGVMLYAISGEYRRCRAYFDKAIEYRGDPATRAEALGLAVLVMTEHDDLDQRIVLDRELTELAAEIGTPAARWSAAHLRMTNQVQTGDPAMRDTLVELADLTGELRQRTRLWEFTNWSASVALTNGETARAEELAGDALACVDAVAESLVMSAYGAQLLSIRHAEGRIGELVDLVAATVADGEAIGAWRAVYALAAVESGDAECARRELDVVVADDFAVLDRDYTFNAALYTAAVAACSVGAIDIVELIEPELARWSGSWAFVGTCALGPIDVALARVAQAMGDHERAADLAERALTSAQRARAPIYEAEAQRLIAELATLASGGA